jgi:uncharacterized lipoprotein NlpE involved in copper resistance
MEVNMTKTMFRMCATIAMALIGSQTLLLAQGKHNLDGTWDVGVTVTNCQTGALIRTVRNLQMYSHDGSFTETANTFLRGSSLGRWDHESQNVYTSTFWFFRYNPDGTFKSIAEALTKIELSGNGSHFTASGTITDYDATGNQLSVGCSSLAARRLTVLDN